MIVYLETKFCLLNKSFASFQVKSEVDKLQVTYPSQNLCFEVYGDISKMFMFPTLQSCFQVSLVSKICFQIGLFANFDWSKIKLISL